MAHLLAIYDQIANDSEMSALKLADRLTKRSEQIGAFPLSGSAVPEYESQDIREVIEGPYRIIYKINPDQVDVLAIIHGQRLLPPTV